MPDYNKLPLDLVKIWHSKGHDYSWWSDRMFLMEAHISVKIEDERTPDELAARYKPWPGSAT